ncbi:MAG: hypothetical protein WC430_00020 [Patescibacteria group bacterium]
MEEQNIKSAGEAEKREEKQNTRRSRLPAERAEDLMREIKHLSDRLENISQSGKSGEKANLLKEEIENLKSEMNEELRELLDIDESQIKYFIEEISRLSGEIDGLALEHFEISGEKGTNKEAVKRLKRHLEVGKLEEELKNNPENMAARETIAKILKGGSWNKILTGLETGDTVVSFLAPSGNFLSVKNMNDNIFGMQGADDVIDFRKKSLKEAFVDYFPNVEYDELEHNYKQGIFKIKPASDESAVKIPDLLNKVCAKVDDEMTKYINGKVDEILAREKNSDKIKKLKDFKKQLNAGGFRFNFGLSKVGKRDGENDFGHIVEAVGNTLQMAQLSREKKDGYGREYSDEAVEKEVSDIANLRKKIYESGNTIADIGGNSFQIFRKDGEKFVFNKDILRALRKGKFAPASGFENIFAETNLYMKKLNLLDIVKPFTAEEISGKSDLVGSGENLKNKLEKLNGLIEKLKNKENKFTPDDVDAVCKELDKDVKDNRCTSVAKFHKEAIKITNCAYISVDALDLGVDLLLEYESALQELEKETDVLKKKNNMKEALVKSGDEATEKMRNVRGKILSVISEANPGVEPLIFVGGDEVTIALDSAKATDELLLKIKEKTNTRVIKTVVAQAERNDKNTAETTGLSVSDKEYLIIDNHIKAMEKSEKGTEQAKKIEEEIRKLRLEAEKKIDRIKFNLNEKPLFYLPKEIKTEQETHSYLKQKIRERFEDFITGRGLDKFIVKEKGGDFTIVDERGRKISGEDVLRFVKEAGRDALAEFGVKA